MMLSQKTCLKKQYKSHGTWFVHVLIAGYPFFCLNASNQTRKRGFIMVKTKTRRLLLIVLALLVFATAAIFVYTQFVKPESGSKMLEISIVHGDNSKKEFKINTDAEYLRGALETRDLIEGTESAYGLFVHTVDGETADENLQQWWCFTKGGEQLFTGIDTIPVSDGDTFEITLTTGW